MPAKIAVRRGVIGRPSQTSGTRSRLSGRVRTARPRRNGGRRVAPRRVEHDRSRHEQRGERRPPFPTARPRRAARPPTRSRRRRARAPDSPSTSTRGAASQARWRARRRCPAPWPRRGAMPGEREGAGQQQRPERRRRSRDGHPGLYAKPAPSARLRAKCRWIHESSRGNERERGRARDAPLGDPVHRERRRQGQRHARAVDEPAPSSAPPRSTVSCARRERRCSRRARPTRSSGSTYRKRPYGSGISSSPGRPRHRGVPVIDEPHELLHLARQLDVRARRQDHGHRGLGRVVAGHVAELHLVDRDTRAGRTWRDAATDTSADCRAR